MVADGVLATVVQTPGLRALAAFGLAVLAGGVVQFHFETLVGRAVVASSDEPLLSLVYGVLAHLLVVFAGGVFNSQLAQIGVDPTTIQVASGVSVGVVLLAFAGLGFSVVGAWLTAKRDEPRPRRGLVGVAALVALAVLVAPPIVGVLAWVVVASVGMGGATRQWVHAERTGATGA